MEDCVKEWADNERIGLLCLSACLLHTPFAASAGLHAAPSHLCSVVLHLAPGLSVVVLVVLVVCLLLPEQGKCAQSGMYLNYLILERVEKYGMPPRTQKAQEELQETCTQLFCPVSS